MICNKPFIRGGQEFGCGQCLPCRINRQRLWGARLHWEWCHAGSGSFVTLTYSELWVPSELEPRHLTLFLKRLRKSVYPAKFRFFAVGEYGETTWRPHFHLLIFPFVAESLVQESWKFGSVHMGMVEDRSIGYCTHYCTKGLTTFRSMQGRRPEFARMSLRPGIGAGVVDGIPLVRNGLALVDVLNGADVPSGAMVNGRLVPYGRYLKRRLRLKLGLGRLAPAEVTAERAREYLRGSQIDSEMDRRKAERSLNLGKAEAQFSIKRSRRSI